MHLQGMRPTLLLLAILNIDLVWAPEDAVFVISLFMLCWLQGQPFNARQPKVGPNIVPIFWMFQACCLTK